MKRHWESLKYGPAVKDNRIKNPWYKPGRFLSSINWLELFNKKKLIQWFSDKNYKKIIRQNLGMPRQTRRRVWKIMQSRGIVNSWQQYREAEDMVRDG